MYSILFFNRPFSYLNRYAWHGPAQKTFPLYRASQISVELRHTPTHTLSMCVYTFQIDSEIYVSAFWPAVSVGVENAACSQNLAETPSILGYSAGGPHTRTPAHSHP